MILIPLLWVPGKALPVARKSPVTTTAHRSTHGLAILAVLGTLGGAAFLTEGTAVDWAGVHAQRVLGASPAAGSLVYTLFFVSMTVIRFAGDHIRARLGPPRTLPAAGLTSACGYALILVAPACAGLAVAMAGRCPHRSGHGPGLARAGPPALRRMGQLT